jgi:transketolase C-terminal domain/subunit
MAHPVVESEIVGVGACSREAPGRWKHLRRHVLPAGREDKRLVVVADISPAGSIAKFREEFPDRFVNTGVAEQIMIGLAAGMALRGLRPFAYTIATFALYRPFEFVRDDIAYQELPVTVVGIGGGVNYSTLGGTHHAMEDIAIGFRWGGLRVLRLH